MFHAIGIHQHPLVRRPDVSLSSHHTLHYSKTGGVSMLTASRKASLPATTARLSAPTTLSQKAVEPGGNVNIQIASDLHLEFYENAKAIPDDIIVPSAPILALLGDIGLSFTDSLETFLHQQADRFEHVLFLAGNHEYYNNFGGQPKSVQEQYEWMQKVCAAKPNLHFMDKDEFRVGTNVTILGTTLWSAIPPSAELVAKQSLNDYHKSYVSVDRKITPNVTNQWHTENRKWLTNKIQEAKECRHTVVVLTHHTPSMEGTSDPKYDGNPLGHCFSTNLTRLLVLDPVAFWVCGHTHYNFDLPSSFGPDSSTTRLVSNQRGYPGAEKKEYKNKMVIEVSSRRR
jgi:hypothetical protein